MKRRISIMVLVALAVVAVLGTAALAQEKVTIRWVGWGTAEQAEMIKQMAADFNAEHDHIELVYEPTIGGDTDYHERLLTSMIGGSSPDVMNLGEQWLPRFVDANLVLPIERYVPQAWVDDVFPQSLLDLTTFNGTLYSMLPNHAHLMYYYNRDLLDAAGLAYPEHEWTFGDFHEMARRLTRDVNNDGTPDQWGFVWDAWWGPMLTYVWSNGGELFNDDMTQMAINTSQAAEALQFVQDFMHQSHFAPTLEEYGPIGGASGAWTTGKAGMLLGGPWSMDSWLTNHGMNIGIVRVPTGPSGEHGETYFPSALFAVSALTEHPQEAMTVWKWLQGSPEQQLERYKDTTTLSSYRSVKLSPEFLREKRLPQGGIMTHQMMVDYVEAASFGRPLPSHSEWMRINGEAIWPYFVQVLQNQISGQAAVDAIKDHGDRLLAQLRAESGN